MQTSNNLLSLKPRGKKCKEWVWKINSWSVIWISIQTPKTMKINLTTQESNPRESFNNTKWSQAQKEQIKTRVKVSKNKFKLNKIWIFIARCLNMSLIDKLLIGNHYWKKERGKILLTVKSVKKNRPKRSQRKSNLRSLAKWSGSISLMEREMLI